MVNIPFCFPIALSFTFILTITTSIADNGLALLSGTKEELRVEYFEYLKGAKVPAYTAIVKQNRNYNITI